MKTNKDYTLNYREYGEITVPKGTCVSNRTALGIDKNYHFVSDFSWIHRNYGSIANLLEHDVEHYGINIPKEFVSSRNDYIPGERYGMSFGCFSNKTYTVLVGEKPDVYITEFGNKVHVRIVSAKWDDTNEEFTFHVNSDIDNNSIKI